MKAKIANQSLNKVRKEAVGMTPGHMYFYEHSTSRMARRILSGKRNDKIIVPINSK